MNSQSLSLTHTLFKNNALYSKFTKLWSNYRTQEILMYLVFRGGDLGGTGGTVPPQKNLKWGDGPCIGPPNILRSSVVGWVRKVEQSKNNRCRQGILFLNI